MSGERLLHPHPPSDAAVPVHDADLLKRRPEWLSVRGLEWVGADEAPNEDGKWGVGVCVWTQCPRPHLLLSNSCIHAGSSNRRRRRINETVCATTCCWACWKRRSSLLLSEDCAPGCSACVAPATLLSTSPPTHYNPQRANQKERRANRGLEEEEEDFSHDKWISDGETDLLQLTQMKGKTGEFQSCLMGASHPCPEKVMDRGRVILIKSASFTETASTGGCTADEMCCLLWHRRAQRTVANLRADSKTLLWQTHRGGTVTHVAKTWQSSPLGLPLLTLVTKLQLLHMAYLFCFVGYIFIFLLLY